MLSSQQLQLCRTAPKTFLAQYKWLELRAKCRLQRLSFFEMYDTTEQYRRELVNEARQFMTLKQDIEILLQDAPIRDKHKEFLYLRFIENRNIQEIQERMHLVKRWLYRVQAEALNALSKSI